MIKKCENIGIDIDDTITAAPEFFRELTRMFKKANPHLTIHIISSRNDDQGTMEFTEKELQALGMVYDYLYLLPGVPENAPAELDWYQQYIWQKVAYCLKNDIGVMYENEEKVKELFGKYAPHVIVIDGFKD